MVAPVIAAAAPFVAGWIDSLVQRLVAHIPDPEARTKAELEARTQLMMVFENSDQRQAEINRAEAENPNLYVAGWRPGIGWVGVASCAYEFLLRPIASVWLPQLPSVGDNMMELVIMMLGLGGLRSFDKIRGTDLRGPFGPTRG